jgi:hypothetical protein
MRKRLSDIVERNRMRNGLYASSSEDGCNGAFIITDLKGVILRIIASDASEPEAEGWEHVSVSLEKRAPDWGEMCFVKWLFWGDDEVVVQFHPVKSEYINCHPNCLHLWRHIDGHKTPPAILVGPK